MATIGILIFLSPFLYVLWIFWRNYHCFKCGCTLKKGLRFYATVNSTLEEDRHSSGGSCSDTDMSPCHKNRYVCEACSKEHFVWFANC